FTKLPTYQITHLPNYPLTHYSFTHLPILRTLFLLYPFSLPMPPQGDIAESELVPPEIEHLLIEMKNSFAGYAGWRWNETGKAIIDQASVGIVYAREQMPECEGILPACLREHGVKRRRTVFRFKAG